MKTNKERLADLVEQHGIDAVREAGGYSYKTLTAYLSRDQRGISDDKLELLERRLGDTCGIKVEK